jgi:hypothetical protein
MSIVGADRLVCMEIEFAGLFAEFAEEAEHSATTCECMLRARLASGHMKSVGCVLLHLC